MRNTPPKPVHRRKVFYIPGYDPIHPRRYRELYRREAAAQGAISGYDIALTASEDRDNFGWQVLTEINGTPTRTQVEILPWADIVRASMSGTLRATYGQMLRTAWIYISTGALFRLMRLRKGPVIAALYPVAALLVQLLIACGAGVAVTAALLWGLEQVWPQSLAGQGWLQYLAAAGAGVALAMCVLRWFQRRDNLFFAHYLMQDYAHAAQGRGAYGSQTETRIAAFTDRLHEALHSDADEILLIGHSSGAYLGCSVLADLLRAGPLPKSAPALGLLTLGQVIPMVAFLPKAQRLRADLHLLAQSGDITWIDVSAPGDGCAFALCDPVGVTGVDPKGKKWPLVLSAAFTQTLSPARWKTLRWRFFRLHFQYLCAFDRPGHYDYFQITAGPQSLSERYAHRPPSKSRIERPVNRYRDLAP